MTSSIHSLSELARAVGAVFLLLAVAANAPAWGRKKDANTEQAKRQFEAGLAAYDLGQFDDALKAYSEAYRLKALPGLLFNIAQCHRQLENYVRAAFFFKRYLALQKRAPNAEIVRDLIKEVETRQAEKLRATQQEAEARATASRAEAEAAGKRQGEAIAQHAVEVARQQREAEAARHQREAEAADRPLASAAPGGNGKTQTIWANLDTTPPVPGVEAAAVAHNKKGGGARKLAWLPATGGVLLTGLGVWSLLQAQAASNQLTGGDGLGGRPSTIDDPFEARQIQRRGEQYGTAGLISTSVGFAALITAGVMFFLGGEGATQAGVTVAPSLAGVAVAGVLP